MINADEIVVLDTGNIIKCKQLTKQDFETLSDEMVESVRHCLDSLSRSFANVDTKVDYTHENHSSVVEANDRDQVRVCVKVFLTRFEENAVHDAVHKALTQLDVNRIESLIVAFPPSGNHKIGLLQMQPVWRACEELIAQGSVCSAGVADLDLSQLSELYQWAPSFKPTTNQLCLDTICNLPKEMTEFAAENNIQLLSHGDDKELTSRVNVRRILHGFKGNVDDWICEFATRYTVSFQCRGVLHSKGYIVKLRRESR
ncbi:glutamate--cysteine ligase regulatory subunit [Galendromus occidentalis]|uniref:GCS light chain n=1 Tax=Galendromus occidentalis TaxID=34638 RepID=A0AAJ6QMJ2_9ACAR|nr:glutamate--cysteine ligase regulatory subunit [Galendromus occidentalis]